jgi:hypothetical protein
MEIFNMVLSRIQHSVKQKQKNGCPEMGNARADASTPTEPALYGG